MAQAKVKTYSKKQVKRTLSARRGPEWAQNVRPKKATYQNQGKIAHEAMKEALAIIGEGETAARQLRNAIDHEVALITDRAGNPLAIGVFGPSVEQRQQTAVLARKAEGKIKRGQAKLKRAQDAITKAREIRAGKKPSSGGRAAPRAAARTTTSSRKKKPSTGTAVATRSKRTRAAPGQSTRLPRAASPGRGSTTDSLRQLPMAELWSMAKKNGLTGYNKLKKDELVKKLARKIQASQRGNG